MGANREQGSQSVVRVMAGGIPSEDVGMAGTAGRRREHIAPSMYPYANHETLRAGRRAGRFCNDYFTIALITSKIG